MMVWRKLVVMLVLLIPPFSIMAGTWVGKCDSPELAGRILILDQVETPQGLSRYLVASNVRLPHCEMQLLPLAVEEIQAGRFISHQMVSGLSQGFALSYEGTTNELKQAEVVPIVPTAAPSASTQPIIMGNDLLAEISLQSFGGEERVSTSRSNTGITLTCHSGSQPAGALLLFQSSSLPKTIPIAIKIESQRSPPLHPTDAEFAGVAEFALGISDQRQLTAEDPLMFAKISPQNGEVELALPSDPFDKNNVRAVSVLCPNHDAVLPIKQLSFVPRTPVKPTPPRATWLWNPQIWRNADKPFFQSLESNRIKTLFVTVPVNLEVGEVDQANQLAAFITRAKQAGVAVWAVTGDPKAVMESERGKFVRIAKAYDQYNQQVPLDARLAGIQYDIEPYLNRGYDVDPAPWLAAYLATLRELKTASSLPMDLAVPFFWASAQTPQGRLLDEIAEILEAVDSLTVMDYRTDPSQIRAFAQPFLEWGSQNHHSIRIALEAGPIADSPLRYYTPANTGHIALVTGSQYGALLAFVEPQPTKPGAIQTFQPRHTNTHSGNAVSFAKRRDELLSLVSALEKQWLGWPGFSGIALHELLGQD